MPIVFMFPIIFMLIVFIFVAIHTKVDPKYFCIAAILLIGWTLISVMEPWVISEQRTLNIFDINHVQVIVIDDEVMNITKYFGRMFNPETHKISVTRYHAFKFGIHYILNTKYGFHEFEVVDTKEQP